MAASLNWRDERALWKYLQPRLLGKWMRIEATTPEGMPDLMGLFRGHVVFIELKLGKPSRLALRPAQREFLHDLTRYGCQGWTCFGYEKAALFFRGDDIGDGTVDPPFFR